jgi:cell division protein FtsN
MMMHPNNRNRRGAILILAIVCVAVTMSIMVLLVRFAMLHHAAQKNQHRAAQANWLAHSALDRAAARLAIDPSYTGETWKIPAEEFLASEQAALVRIAVKPVAERPERRTVDVAADYPDAPRHRVRRSKQITIAIAAPASNKPKPDNSKQPNDKLSPKNGEKS